MNFNTGEFYGMKKWSFFLDLLKLRVYSKDNISSYFGLIQKVLAKLCWTSHKRLEADMFIVKKKQIVTNTGNMVMA